MDLKWWKEKNLLILCMLPLLRLKKPIKLIERSEYIYFEYEIILDTLFEKISKILPMITNYWVYCVDLITDSDQNL